MQNIHEMQRDRDAMNSAASRLFLSALVLAATALVLVVAACFR